MELQQYETYKEFEDELDKENVLVDKMQKSNKFGLVASGGEETQS